MNIRGQAIRTLREEQGYTLRQLAGMADLSVSYLSEIERGQKRPSARTIDKLAKALGIPRDSLVDGSVKENGLSLGQKMQLIRAEKCISLETLADQIQVSASFLREVENDSVNPAPSILKGIAKELGVPLMVLTGYQGSLGHKVKMLREEYVMTQAQLAKMTGVTAGMIAQIEQGKVQPSLRTLQKLARVLGVTPCYFIIEAAALDQLLSMMSPEVQEMLLDPNVQSVLSQLSNMSRIEAEFILNFIQLYRQSRMK